jgi:DNA-directed RNA polymerase subunit RPC12/RpoP
MIVVVCPCCSSNNIDCDEDEYELNTSSCIFFKCINCGAEFEKAQANYDQM